jgi:hypothetical protein
MQLIEGVPLHKAVLDLRELLGAVRDAAKALHHAHERRIVHRDVKPSNIMIDRLGRVFVTDFGLARRVEVTSILTVMGAILGTPNYMAPEQAEGEEAEPRSDVYSLGATLYECLTGQAPFSASDPVQTLVRVRSEEVPPPRKLRRSIPRDVETIVLKAMEKEASRRYASASELADDIQRYLDGEPIRAKRSSIVYRLRKKLARHRWVAVAVASTVLLLALGAGIVSNYLDARREFALGKSETDRSEKLRHYEKAEWWFAEAKAELPRLRQEHALIVDEYKLNRVIEENAGIRMLSPLSPPDSSTVDLRLCGLWHGAWVFDARIYLLFTAVTANEMDLTLCYSPDVGINGFKEREKGFATATDTLRVSFTVVGEKHFLNGRERTLSIENETVDPGVKRSSPFHRLLWYEIDYNGRLQLRRPSVSKFVDAVNRGELKGEIVRPSPKRQPGVLLTDTPERIIEILTHLDPEEPWDFEKVASHCRKIDGARPDDEVTFQERLLCRVPQGENPLRISFSPQGTYVHPTVEPLPSRSCDPEKYFRFSKDAAGMYVTLVRGYTWSGWPSRTIPENIVTEGPFDSVGEVVITRDGNRLAYAVSKAGRSYVVHAGTEGETFDEILWGPRFSADDTHFAYIARLGRKACVVVNGRKHPEHDEVGCLIFGSDEGSVAYFARDGARFMIEERGKTIPVAHRVLAIAPRSESRVPSYLMLDPDQSKTFLSVGGQVRETLGLARSLGSSPYSDAVAYASRDQGKEFVVFQDKKGEEFDEVSDPVVNKEGTTVSYWAVERDRLYLICGNGRGEAFDAKLNPRSPAMTGQGPIFSADGKRVAFGVRKGREVWWKVMEAR